MFRAYDTDNSGQLEQEEVKTLINDALSYLNQNKKVSSEEINAFIMEEDKDNDGMISEKELFGFWKKILNKYAQERKWLFDVAWPILEEEGAALSE